jgi:hypothetical protein
MSSISFKSAEEVAVKNFVKLTCGIHEVNVEEIFFQPEGNCVKGSTKKDKSVIVFKKPCYRLKVKVKATNKGEDAKGAESILMYALAGEGVTAGGKDRVTMWLNRTLHLFSNMSKSTTKDKAKEYIQKLDEPSFESLLGKLKHFEKRDVRLKFVANDQGFAQLPSWESGFAECIDIPFENSELKYDATKEGPQEGPANAEIPSTRTDVPNWSVPSTSESVVEPMTEIASDDLPF